MESFTWIVGGLIGTVGVVGAICFFVIGPAVVIPIVQSVVGRIISCRVCLYVILLVASCCASWWFGHHQAVIACKADELAAQLRNQQIDNQIAQKAAADEANRAIDIEVAADAQKKKDAEYISTLEARPGCLLDDSDIDRLPNDGNRAGGQNAPSRAKPSR
jgi:hypothetical protein